MELPVKQLLGSYSYLALVRNPIFGIILLAVTFINPTSALLALLSFIASFILGKYIGISDRQLECGLYTYNSLLIGLLMGYLFKLTFLSCVFTIMASFLTLMLSYSLYNLFLYYLNVPILNIPFTISATLVFLSSIRYSNLLVAGYGNYTWLNMDFLPYWLSGFLKSVGILLFLPYDVAGIAILAAMVIFSRINFFLMIVGYYTGALFLGAMKGSLPLAFGDLYNFNFILVALALGGVFLIPSPKTYIIALIGVVISAFILDAITVFWSSYGIPVFTFPFALTVTLILYVLKTTKFKFITLDFLISPEHNLEHYINHSERFIVSQPQPMLPFMGEWKVYQASDGEWTHKGPWRYAVDFVIEDQSRHKTYQSDGLKKEDYHCFGKPVLSPISGIVVDFNDESDDNFIGYVDKRNNWGNYIIIQSPWGYYIELSHLQKASVTVRRGEVVTVGQKIGNCGNSGYSPQPHIHLQCQNLPAVGSPSIPFAFTNCIANEKALFGNVCLQKGDEVRPIVPSRVIENKLQFILDEVYTYSVKKQDRVQDVVRFEVRMDPSGCYYFFEPKSASKLFFQHGDGVFSFFRYEGNPECYLTVLFLALPRVPFTEETVVWSDSINPAILHGNKPMESFLKSFNHNLFATKGNYVIYADGVVKGTIESHCLLKSEIIQTECKFDLYRGFYSVRVERGKENITLLRVAE